MSNVRTGLDEQISISLAKGTLLVLFEFLAHSHNQWKGSASEQLSQDTFVLAKPDAAERVALWHLEGAIERTLPEILASDYKDLIAGWKAEIDSRNED